MTDTPSDNLYHLHLDSCTQCRENPFGMCEGGLAALRLSVHGSDGPDASPVRRPSALELLGVSPDEQKLIKEVAPSVIGPWARFIR